MITNLKKIFSRKKDMHHIYFSDMKIDEFIRVLSNPGYGVYIKRNKKDQFIDEIIASSLEEICLDKNEPNKMIFLSLMWVMIQVSLIKPFYATGNSEYTKSYITDEINGWLKEAYPVIRNMKIGDEKEMIHRQIFHIFEISEDVLPKTLACIYQKAISEKMIALEGKIN